MIRRPPSSTLFPTRRSSDLNGVLCLLVSQGAGPVASVGAIAVGLFNSIMFPTIFTITLERSTASNAATSRSEEHTSELQSHVNLVCRLLLEKKKKKKNTSIV